MNFAYSEVMREMNVLKSSSSGILKSTRFGGNFFKEKRNWTDCSKERGLPLDPPPGTVLKQRAGEAFSRPKHSVESFV